MHRHVVADIKPVEPLGAEKFQRAGAPGDTGTVRKSAQDAACHQLHGKSIRQETDPPALAFASNVCRSEAPAVAYATVYPLTMLLRIMTAQVLAVVLCG